MTHHTMHHNVSYYIVYYKTSLYIVFAAQPYQPDSQPPMMPSPVRIPAVPQQQGKGMQKER